MEEAATLQRIMQLPGTVRGQYDDRRIHGVERRLVVRRIVVGRGRWIFGGRRELRRRRRLGKLVKARASFEGCLF